MPDVRVVLDCKLIATESDKIKAHANGCNKSRHCCVLLGVFGQQCYVRLHGPIKVYRFQIIRNKCQHCCGSMQTVANCSWAQQCCPACCWPTMLRPFAWAFKALLFYPVLEHFLRAFNFAIIF